MFSSPAHVLPLPEFRNGIQLFNREKIQKSFHDAFNFTTASCSDPAYLVVVQEHDVGPQPHPRYVGLAVGGGRVVQARSLTITGREPMWGQLSVRVTTGICHCAEIKQTVGSGNGHQMLRITGNWMLAIHNDVCWRPPGSQSPSQSSSQLLWPGHSTSLRRLFNVTLIITLHLNSIIPGRVLTSLSLRLVHVNEGFDGNRHLSWAEASNEHQEDNTVIVWK